MKVTQSLSDTGVTQLHVQLAPNEKFFPANLTPHLPPQQLVYQNRMPVLKNQFMELIINNDRRHIIEVHLALTQNDKMQMMRKDFRNEPPRFSDPNQIKVRRARAGQRAAGKNLQLTRDDPKTDAGKITLQRLSAKPEQINGESVLLYHSYGYQPPSKSLPESGDEMSPVEHTGTVAAVEIKNSMNVKGGMAFAEVYPHEIELARDMGGVFPGRDIIAPLDPQERVDDLVEGHGVRGSYDTDIITDHGRPLPITRSAPDRYVASVNVARFHEEVIKPYAYFSAQAVVDNKHIVMTRVRDDVLKEATLKEMSGSLKSLFKKKSEQSASQSLAVAVKDAAAGADIKGGKINNTGFTKLEKFEARAVRNEPGKVRLRGHWDYQGMINNTLSFRSHAGRRMTMLTATDKGLNLNDIFRWYQDTDRLKVRNSLIDPSCKPDRPPTFGTRPENKLDWRLEQKNLPPGETRAWQGKMGSKSEWSEVTDATQLAYLKRQLDFPES